MRFPPELSQTSPPSPLIPCHLPLYHPTQCLLSFRLTTNSSRILSAVCAQNLQKLQVSIPHLSSNPLHHGGFLLGPSQFVSFFSIKTPVQRNLRSCISVPPTCCNRNGLETLRHFCSSKILLSLEKSLISGGKRDSSQGLFVI